MLPHTPSLARRYLTVSGLRLAYLEQGTAAPDSPSIMLLHGLVAEGETFRKLISYLPQGRHIIAIDLPGAGYSDRPLHGDVSFVGMAAVVREAFSQLSLHKPILLGHSHGGAVSTRLAVDNPELLTALILLAPAHPFFTQGDKLVRFYLSKPGRLFARALPLLPWRLHLFAFKIMPGSRSAFGHEEIKPYLHTLRTPGTVPHLLRLLSTWMSDMALLRADLRENPISLPTLCLWGERDAVVPIGTSARFLQHFGSATLVPLQGIGHLPNEEAPQACADAIVSFCLS